MTFHCFELTLFNVNNMHMCKIFIFIIILKLLLLMFNIFFESLHRYLLIWLNLISHEVKRENNNSFPKTKQLLWSKQDREIINFFLVNHDSCFVNSLIKMKLFCYIYCEWKLITLFIDFSWLSLTFLLWVCGGMHKIIHVKIHNRYCYKEQHRKTAVKEK